MNNELLEILKDLLHQSNIEDKLNSLLEEYHPYDISLCMKELNDQERQALYDYLSLDQLASILEYLDEESSASYLQEMSYSQGADVLNEMAPDDAADVLNEMTDEEDKSDYLEQMDKEAATTLSYLAKHEESTAGSIMSTEFVTLQIGTDVKEATRILGYEAHDAEVIDPLFVCDGDILKGIVKLQDLIIARTPKLIDEIMDDNFVYATIDEDIISAAKKTKDYNIYALPVLDNGHLKGIITMDDALDVAQESIDEDYGLMATVNSFDNNESIFKKILKRLPWLVCLLIISLLVSNITASFEETISKITVLWFFNTMILGMAGNAGTQNLSIAVRRIGRNELDKPKDIFRYLSRELLVGLLNGILLGILCFGVTIGFIMLLKFNTEVNAFMCAFVIALSLCVTLIVTSLLGSVVPIIMDKLHIDPAYASGPLISTVNDILALVIYFSLATSFMDKILL